MTFAKDSGQARPLHALETKVCGAFEGYAAYFNVYDHHGDRLERGAFRATLRAWQNIGQWPPFFYQHQPPPIGALRMVREDVRGLWVSGQFCLKSQAGQRAYRQAQSGTRDLSIGFEVVTARPEIRGRRRLFQVHLWEISLVGKAANPWAHMTSLH